MKIQNDCISVDEFQIQLLKIKEQQQQLTQKYNIKHDWFFYNLDSLPISISTITSIFYFSLNLLWPIHFISVYQNMLEIVQPQANNIIGTTLLDIIIQTNTIGNVINIITFLLSLLTIFFHVKSQDSGFLYIFQYIGSNLYPYLRIMLIFGLYSSAFYAIDQKMLQIIIFLLHVFLSLFQHIFLQNLIIKKDQFHCQAYDYLILSRVIILSSLCFSVFFINLNATIILIYSVIQLLLAIAMLILYFTQGISIYRNKAPRIVYSLIIFCFLATSIACFIDATNVMMFNKQSKKYMYIFLFHLCIIFSGYMQISYRKRNSGLPQNKYLRQKVFFIINKLQNSDIDEEDDCEVRGMILHHTIRECLNPQCIANSKQAYDAKKKKSCNINKILSSKQSLTKFCIKCLFQKQLQQQQNIDLMIDYLQFNYLQLKNQYKVLTQIYSLEQKYQLNVLQKLKIKKLVKLINQDSKKLSQQLFYSQLYIQQIIQSQHIFDKIQALVNISLKRNQLFWKYLSRDQLSLTHILNTIKPNLILEDILSNDWNKLFPYFSVNKRWKFYFVCFTVYIKNQKIKSSMIQDFGNSIQIQSLFKPTNYFIDKTTQKQNLFNPIMLFQQNTCFLHAKYDDDKMIILRTSHMFERNFGFTSKQMQNSTLNILLPLSIQKIHQKLFQKWIKQGRNTTEEYYPVKKIYPLTQKGYLNPCFKFYKTIMQISGDLQYVAMFKRNKQQQMFILANQHFQIQAITFGLSQKLKLSFEDNNCFIGINLLCFIPMIVKYTKYAKFLTQGDDDYLQNDDNAQFARVKTQSGMKQGESNEQTKQDILHRKKVMNLTNVKLFIPIELQQAKIQFNKILTNKDNNMTVIRQFFKWIKKTKYYNRYRGQITIRERQFMGNIFYQFQISQLQQNNRLNKLNSQQQKKKQQSVKWSQKQIYQVLQSIIDIDQFFQVDTKKNRIVLSSTNNLFIKQQNNRALLQIDHIKNIMRIIRFILIFFLLILISGIIFQFVSSSQLSWNNTGLQMISFNQKMLFTIVSGLDTKLIKVSNPILNSFVIANYIRLLMENSQSKQYLSIITNIQYNQYYLSYPIYKQNHPISSIFKNKKFPPLDNIQIFTTVYQNLIQAGHLVVQNYDKNMYMQDSSSYFIANNYIFELYEKIEKIKKIFESKIQNKIQFMELLLIIFVIFQVSLLIISIIFSLFKVIKVTQGFNQLLSIFIQIDQKQILKIIKYIEYVDKLFLKLNRQIQVSKQPSFQENNNVKMIRTGTLNKASQNSQELTQQFSTTNLNKKIKKMDYGNQIQHIKLSLLIKISVFLIFFGAIILSPYIYSYTSIGNIKQIQKVGFQLFENSTVINILIDGLFQKNINLPIYNKNKYEKYLQINDNINKFKLYLDMTTMNQQFSYLYSQIYYNDFCNISKSVVEQSFNEQFNQTCSKFNNQTCKKFNQSFNASYVLNYCGTIEDGILKKGLANYYNYLNTKIQQYFKQINTLSVEDLKKIINIQNVITIYQTKLYNFWLDISDNLLNNRLYNLIILAIVVFFTTIITHIFFIQVLVSRELKQNYQIFRRMYEAIIPQFIINNQKIIKAKLVKEGFMKQ